MSRSAWVAWVVAVVLILIGLWLVDHTRAASVTCIAVALVLMVAVMALDTPKCPGGTAGHRIRANRSTAGVSRRAM